MVARDAAKQKREKCMVADSVKGVHVGSATRRTKEPHGVADAAKCMRGKSASKWHLNSRIRGWRYQEREGC
jgi:hypothetical protein